MRLFFFLSLCIFFHPMSDPNVFGQSEDDDATKILKRAIAAHGGKDKLAMGEKVYGKSQMNAAVTASSWTELPNSQKKIIQEVASNGEKRTFYSVTTGDKGWVKMPNAEIRPMTQPEILFEKESRYRAKVRLLYPILEKQNTFQVIFRGEVERGKRLTQQVTVSSEGQIDIDLYFEKKTGLLVEHSSKTVAPEADVRVAAARTLEFKETSGLISACRIMTLIDDEPFGEVVEVLEREYLKEFPQGTFEMPDLVDEKSATILKTAIAAHGGKEKLAMLEKFYIKTRVTPNIPIGGVILSNEQWTELPNKRKLAHNQELSIGQKFTAYFIQNVDQAWAKAPGQKTHTLTKEEVHAEREHLYRHSLRLLYPILENKNAFHALYGGEVKRGKRLTQRITIRSDDQFDVDLFFEKESGLLVEYSAKSLAPRANGRVASVHFLEFKEFSGLIYPSRDASLVEGEQLSEGEVLELRFLKEFPKGTFDKP